MTPFERIFSLVASNHAMALAKKKLATARLQSCRLSDQ
jgi:hypothetical protein